VACWARRLRAPCRCASRSPFRAADRVAKDIETFTCLVAYTISA